MATVRNLRRMGERTDLPDDFDRRASDRFEARMRRVEKTLFGHQDEESNVWIDGLLQTDSDTRTEVKAIKHMVRIGGAAVVLLLLAIVTKQYDVIGWLKLIAEAQMVPIASATVAWLASHP